VDRNICVRLPQPDAYARRLGDTNRCVGPVIHPRSEVAQLASLGIGRLEDQLLDRVTVVSLRQATAQDIGRENLNDLGHRFRITDALAPGTAVRPRLNVSNQLAGLTPLELRR
jgi:hypothetical protein